MDAATDPIDIGQPLREITGRLGLEHTNVLSLLFEPYTITAVVALTKDGSKYFEGDNEVASETTVFKVKT